MATLIVLSALLLIAIGFYYRSKNTNSIVRRLGIQNDRGFRPLGRRSPVAKINDPIIAAATLIIAVQSEEFVLGEGDTDIVEQLLMRITDQEQAIYATSYAHWAVIEVGELDYIIETLGSFLGQHLNDDEKLEFLEMLDDANSSIGGSYDFDATRRQLIQYLGFETTH